MYKSWMKTVNSSTLRAQMGRYMAALRRGEGIIVADRGVPIGTLAPLPEAASPPRRRALRLTRAKDPAAPALGDVEIVGVAYGGPSSTALLAEDRRRR